jgi:large subunit ribosomal protein L25
MKHPLLVAEERTVLGKKVKKLRREGLLPVNVYGKGVPSVALQVKLNDFQSVYKQVGETSLLDLQYNGATKPVLIKNLQIDYKSFTPLHADFYQVNLKEKIKTMVPVLLVGEAKAVTDNVGMLLQTLSDVEVEALPEGLPEHIEISVEHLEAVGDQVTVGDLKAPEGVAILTDAGQLIAKIGELTVKEEEPEEEAVEEGAETPEGAESDSVEEEDGEASEGGEEAKEETPAEENASE